jgi:hypothetical protein
MTTTADCISWDVRLIDSCTQWMLYITIRRMHSVGYPIYLLVCIGQVVNVYSISFGRSVKHVSFVKSGGHPLGRLKRYNVIIFSTFLSDIRTEGAPAAVVSTVASMATAATATAGAGSQLSGHWGCMGGQSTCGFGLWLFLSYFGLASTYYFFTCLICT